jgi:septal ring factor EnvC (AmiA/AmiB activator)
MFIRKSKHEAIVAGLSARLERATMRADTNAETIHRERRGRAQSSSFAAAYGAGPANELRFYREHNDRQSRQIVALNVGLRSRDAEIERLGKQLRELRRRVANQRESLTNVIENAPRFGTSLQELIRKPVDPKAVPYCEALAKGRPICCGSSPCKLQPTAGCAGDF